MVCSGSRWVTNRIFVSVAYAIREGTSRGITIKARSRPEKKISRFIAVERGRGLLYINAVHNTKHLDMCAVGRDRADTGKAVPKSTPNRIFFTLLVVLLEGAGLSLHGAMANCDWLRNAKACVELVERVEVLDRRWRRVLGSGDIILSFWRR